MYFADNLDGYSSVQYAISVRQVRSKARVTQPRISRQRFYQLGGTLLRTRITAGFLMYPTITTLSAFFMGAASQWVGTVILNSDTHIDYTIGLVYSPAGVATVATISVSQPCLAAVNWFRNMFCNLVRMPKRKRKRCYQIVKITLSGVPTKSHVLSERARESRSLATNPAQALRPQCHLYQTSVTLNRASVIQQSASMLKRSFPCHTTHPRCNTATGAD